MTSDNSQYKKAQYREECMRKQGYEIEQCNGRLREYPPATHGDRKCDRCGQLCHYFPRGVCTNKIWVKKKGCFLTTACTQALQLPDDCEELQTLRGFRDGFLAQLPNGSAEIRHYYTIAPAIVDAIGRQPDAQQIYDALYYELVLKSVCLIRNGRLEQALRHYRGVSLDLSSLYL